MRRSIFLSVVGLTIAGPTFFAAQVAAQTPAPAQTPSPGPTPTATPTLPEAIGVGRELNWLTALWDRVGWWVFGLIALVILVLVLRAFGKGFLGGVEKVGERAADMFFGLVARIVTWRRLPTPLRKYLDWLNTEYGRLPQIGVATEQVALDLDVVHVPLQVVERAAAEAYYKRMRGEQDGEAPTDGASNAAVIFLPLSDPRLLERVLQRARKQQRGRPSSIARQRALLAAKPDQADRAPQTFTRLLLLGDAGSGCKLQLSSRRFSSVKSGTASV